MPRHRKVGMPRPKKKAVEQPSEAVEMSPAPPDASEPAAPPSPEPTPQKPAWPKPSPGAKAVKEAAYAARKADRVAQTAYKSFLREKLAFIHWHVEVTNKMERLGKDWKKRGRPGRSYHLQKLNNNFLAIEAKRVRLLQTQLVASELAVDAKDAAIAERDARLHRLRRLNQRKFSKARRKL